MVPGAVTDFFRRPSGWRKFEQPRRAEPIAAVDIAKNAVIAEERTASSCVLISLHLRCPHPRSRSNAVGNLLHYAIVFLVVALVAAFFGFGGVAGTAMEGARILFWVAIVLLVVSLIANFLRKA